VRNADRSVADCHFDWFKERARGWARYAIPVIKTKNRTVEGAHDMRFVHHHELTGTGL
jgi:hypothetical protein